MWAVWSISMDQRLYIALLGFMPDDGVSASLFDGLLATLVALVHQTEKTPVLFSK
jgi:hypothetical protein